MICVARCYKIEEVREGEVGVGGGCGTMSDRRCVEGLVVKPEGQSAWKMGVDGRVMVMVMRLTETEWEGVDWLHLAQDKGKWRAGVRWIFRKWDVGAWTGSSWLRIRTGGGHL